MILYLVVDDDDHAESVYYLRRDKQDALNLARRLADEAQAHYGDMPAYVSPCIGVEGRLFCEAVEERWRVTVCEVVLE